LVRSSVRRAAPPESWPDCAGWRSWCDLGSCSQSRGRSKRIPDQARLARPNCSTQVPGPVPRFADRAVYTRCFPQRGGLEDDRHWPPRRLGRVLKQQCRSATRHGRHPTVESKTDLKEGHLRWEVGALPGSIDCSTAPMWANAYQNRTTLPTSNPVGPERSVGHGRTLHTTMAPICLGPKMTAIKHTCFHQRHWARFRRTTWGLSWCAGLVRGVCSGVGRLWSERRCAQP